MGLKISWTHSLFVRSVANGGIAVPFRGPPRYNPKRRSAAWGGWWAAGDRSSLASSTRIPAELDALLRRQPTSPCSLERPFSSASSSISDASHPSHEDDASIVTGNSPRGKTTITMHCHPSTACSMCVVPRRFRFVLFPKFFSSSPFRC